MIFVDTNILIDGIDGDPVWGEWSLAKLAEFAERDALVINYIVFAELSAHLDRVEAVDAALRRMGVDVLDLDTPTASRAGRAFREYRHRGGVRTTMIPDFLIAAHASTLGASLLTRDKRRVGSYFPEITLITPETDNG